MIIEVFMKKISILFLLLIISASVNSQTKYLIYFKDKDISPNNSLQKLSALFKLAERELSERAIERRKQVMGEDHYITYEDLPINENYISQIGNAGIKIENKLKWFNAVSAYLTNQQLAQVKKISCVEQIELVRVLKYKPEIDNDPTNLQKQILQKNNSSHSLNYGPSFTQAELSDIPAVHDLGIKGDSVIIGILDSGFRWKSHNSLKNLSVLNEKDFIQNDNVTENQAGDAANQDGHGTAVFSIIAGFDQGNIVGPAYGSKFLLAKTEYVPTETNVEEDNYAAALEWMESQGVDITTSSLGYNIFDNGQRSYTYQEMNGTTTKVAQAANLAFQRGVTSFTAAGNDGSSFWGVGNGGLSSPGDALNIITVGAVASGNVVAGFSSRGPTSDGRKKPEVVAMGVNDYHAVVGGSYGNGDGTSYATPIAAGIAALLKSCWPHLTNLQIRKIFLECGDNAASPNNDRGWGLISAKQAISYPNLSAVGNIYNVINKIFINSDGVQPTTVRLNFKIGTGPNQSVNMNTVVFNNTLKYNYTLPVSANGTTVEFYFTYLTNAGGSAVEPANGTYKFSYGSYNISNLTSVKGGNEIPSQFYLSQNYPNPFNPSTVIGYRLSVISKVSLKVYDLLGREVETLVNEVQLPGSYNSQFSIRNSQLPSGVYFYRLQTGDFSETKKMILLK